MMLGIYAIENEHFRESNAIIPKRHTVSMLCLTLVHLQLYTGKKWCYMRRRHAQLYPPLVKYFMVHEKALVDD